MCLSLPAEVRGQLLRSHFSLPQWVPERSLGLAQAPLPADLTSWPTTLWALSINPASSLGSPQVKYVEDDEDIFKLPGPFRFLWQFILAEEISGCHPWVCQCSRVPGVKLLWILLQGGEGLVRVGEGIPRYIANNSDKSAFPLCWGWPRPWTWEMSTLCHWVHFWPSDWVLLDHLWWDSGRS